MGGATVAIDTAALGRFVEGLDVERVRRSSQMRVQLPMVFDNFEQEVNFWALHNLLWFGSGWHELSVRQHGSKDGVPHRDSVSRALWRSSTA